MPELELRPTTDPALQILLADGPSQVLRRHVDYLVAQGLSLFHARSFRQIGRIVAREQIDVLLLDRSLQPEAGRSFEAEIGRLHVGALIVVADHSNEDDLVRTLASRADDYLEAVCASPHLLARIAAVARGHQAKLDRIKQQPIRLGGLLLNIAEQTLRGPHDRAVLLTSREVAIMAAFMARAGHVLTRGELLDLTYDQAGVYDRAIDLQIHRLRSKLRMNHVAVTIRTVHGTGYQFDPFGASANR